MSQPPALPAAVSGLDAPAFARRCADRAGGIMREGLGRAVMAGVKGRGNVLTETDLAVERAVMDLIAEEFPDHAILSEESAPETTSSGWMWVIDPIDGTKNFSRGIPHCCFTMALCHDAVPLLGITLQPFLGEEYLAVRGGGATLNGRRMRVGDAASVRESVVAIDLGYSDERGRRQLELALALFPGVESIRIPGSAALGLAYVAAGRYDLFIHSSLYPWDLAAGIVLIQEAGGLLTGRDGAGVGLADEGVVAGTPGAHADFMQRAGGLPWRA